MDPRTAGVVDLLLHLRERNVHVWTDGQALRYNAPAGTLTDELRGGLRERKADIIAFLASVGSAERTTCYVPMRDGVELAADIFRPTRGGAVVEQPLPVIWCHDRYHRSDVSEGIIETKLDAQPWLRTVLEHGYVIAVVDARGTGASQGVRTSEFSEEETLDGYDVTEWLASQPWCNRRVGMYGDSYLGIAQYLTAGTAPPHLRAIFPEMAMFDLYSFLYPGGVFRDDFVRQWGQMVRELDTEVSAAPVEGRLASAAEALADHRGNRDVLAHGAAFPYRDSRDLDDGAMPHRDLSPSRALDGLNASGVAICHLSGWYDLWVRDAIVWYRNLGNPQRLVIGGWCHNSRAGFDSAAEHLRWYDYWLKGIDNGVMDEPPVRYFTMSAPAGTEWRSAWEWPPPESSLADHYLREGPSGSAESVNDGRISLVAPADDEGHDDYTVDYTTSSGTSNRWTNGYGGDFGYNLTPNDRKALTYTTEPLAEDLEVTGHPVARLFVASSHDDGDFFVYLEEVDEDGHSHYVTEGVLRASHRQVAQPPFDYLGLPYHPSTQDTIEPLGDEPVELAIDLHPTSNVFVAGRRIRVSITCCDADNTATPVHEPPPVIRLFRNRRYPSRIQLPVRPADLQ